VVCIPHIISQPTCVIVQPRLIHTTYHLIISPNSLKRESKSFVFLKTCNKAVRLKTKRKANFEVDVDMEVEVDVEVEAPSNRPHHSAMLLLHFFKKVVPTVRCGFPIDVQQNAQLSVPLFWGRLFLGVGVPRKGMQGRT
jgi:hypothetical protein